MTDLRPPLDPLFSAFGITATVTVPGGGPVAAIVVLDPQAPDNPSRGLGAGLALHDSLMRLVARRSDFASLPTGTEIKIGARTWVVAVEDVPNLDDELVVVGVR